MSRAEGASRFEARQRWIMDIPIMLASRPFYLVLGAFTVAFSLAAAAVAAPSIAWVQMTEGGAELRLVTTAAACPTIGVDGRRRPTVERATPTEAFANRVCAARLAPGDRSLAVDGVILAAPRARPNRIVILGDSGCRLKGQAFQHCNDPSGWPFGRIAALAAARKPDLVIHVGDYYYRETPCPAGNAGCAGSPYGDRWATWKAEVFDPAAPLLAAAPWVFARGNHEDCKRGGAGWFRQLDAAPKAKSCPGRSDSFFVELGGVRLLLADSAETDDLTAPTDKVAAFAASLGALAPKQPCVAKATIDFAFSNKINAAKSSKSRQTCEGLLSDGGEPVWIVTHRPIWDSSRLGELVADGLVNATERQAVKSRDLSDVGLVLSGHVHNFTSLSFGQNRPPQLVVGTGGDTLDMDDAPPPAAGTADVDGLKADIFTMGRWGYFVFDRSGRDWVGRFYDTRDRDAADCLLHGRDLTCRAPKG